MKGRELVFALTWQRNSEPVGTKMAALARWLGHRIGRPVTPRCALSYEELIPMFASEQVDVAWLPPIVHRHLRRARLVQSLLVNERKGSARFSAMLVAHRGSPHAALDKLAGARAAWVDPWSASGYVVPRLVLFERGLLPKDALLEERFFGSHDAALRAVASGRYDVGATFAYFEGDVTVRSGLDEIRGEHDVVVLERLGDVPADLIATRASLDHVLQDALAEAFVAALDDPSASELLRGTLGVERFVRVPRLGDRRSEPHDALGDALDRARAAGLWTHI